MRFQFYNVSSTLCSTDHLWEIVKILKMCNNIFSENARLRNVYVIYKTIEDILFCLPDGRLGHERAARPQRAGGSALTGGRAHGNFHGRAPAPGGRAAGGARRRFLSDFRATVDSILN